MTDAQADPLNTSLDMQGLKRRSLHGAAATFLAQLIKFVLQFGSQIVLARFLDPAQYGLVALIAPILGFVQTLNELGFGQAIIQKNQVTQRQISALFWISVGLGAALSVIVMLAAPAIAWLYSEPRIIPITLVLASLIVVGSLTLHPMALLNRQMRFLPLATIDVGAILCSAVVGTALA